jgi:hypothetical protein
MPMIIQWIDSQEIDTILLRKTQKKPFCYTLIAIRVVYRRTARC